MRDERAILGFLALHVLVAAPGAALLYATGLIRARPVAVVAAAGPAFLTGVVVVGLPLILLLTAGVTVTTPVSLAVVLVLTAVLALVALRRPAPPPSSAEGEPPPRAERAIVRVVLAATAAYLALGAVAFAHLSTAWDDANIWSLKGLGLYHHGSLVAELFRNPQLSYVHLDYPILQPLLEASFFRAIGEVDSRLWHLELWLLFGAVIWTLAWLLAPLGRRWLWAIVLGVVALSPIVLGNVTLGNADTLMAGLVGCGALCLGIWLERGHRAHAIFGALFLGAAANVKNEGLAFGVAVVVALALVVVIGRVRGRRRGTALIAGGFAACVLPWQIWVAGNEAAARATPSPWQLLDTPSFLSDRLDFLWRGIQRVVTDVLATPAWGVLVPCLLVLAIVLIRLRRHPAVASFYVTAWALSGLAVGYTYWVTPIGDLDAFELRTGPRIVLGVVFIAAAGLAHLLQLTTSVATSAEPDVTAAERGERLARVAS